MIRRHPILSFCLALLLGSTAYLCFWPVPVEPVAWNPPKFTYGAAAYSGVHARNTKLAKMQHISIGVESGPEHIMLGPDGMLYAAVASGAILRMKPDGSAQTRFVSTGGRVLGFDFDRAGNLIAADAMRGLLSIAPDGKLTVLADQMGGAPIRYADAVVVAKSGKIYFSDASQRFGPKAWGGTFEASVLDIIEHSSTGRILEYDPVTKLVRVLMQDLCFANGVALSADEKHLFVAETGEYRVWKLGITADKLSAKAAAGGAANSQARVLLANLPGYPDNLMRGLDGKIWLGFAKPRGKPVDDMADKPFLRKLTLRLPRALWPVPPAYGHVIAFDESGKVLIDLQDPSGAYPETTAITETKERLYVQSLHAKTLGWLPRP